MTGFSLGLSGIPINAKFFKKKPNPEISKQWRDIDKKKHKKKEQEKLREIRQTKRVEKKRRGRPRNKSKK